MADETLSVISLRLDATEAIANATELGDVLGELSKASVNISAAISKSFSSMLNSLKKIHTEFNAVSTSVNSFKSSISDVKPAAEEALSVSSLFDDITAGYDSMKGFVDDLGGIDKYSEKFQALFQNVTSSSNLGELLKNVLPKTDGLFETVNSWINNDVIKTITDGLAKNGGSIGSSLSGIITSVQGAFSGIGSALSGMSLGWGAAIAGIITLIVLLVQNWDTVQAAIVAAWEAIQAAVGTAAEWLNTNVIQPVIGFFAEAWNAVTAVFAVVGAWFDENVIQPIIGVFTPIVEWFGTLFGSIWQTVSDVFYNIGVIISGCWEILQAVWGIVAEWFNTNVIQPVATFFSGLWAGICDFAKGAWEGIVGVFSAVATWFDTNVIQPVASFFRGMWEGFIKAATDAWNAVVVVFSAVAGFFGDIFSQAWSAVVAVFSIAGEIFNNIKDGILTVFISIVNGLITGINSVVRIPFNGINGAISAIRSINIFDIQPFSGLRTINVPQIPYLAKGAVLPANRPFLAVVGDQRHGTNIEAPLTTIQEAVAVVMEDHISAMMSGFQALLEENRMLRQTVAAIEVGDDTIGQAAARYNSKMAIVRGGLF